MKIVYIGAGDALAETLAERMGQEGNDVYLLLDKELPQKPKGVSPHRFYRRPHKGEAFQKLLRSISPDCVIFAGSGTVWTRWSSGRPSSIPTGPRRAGTIS